MTSTFRYSSMTFLLAGSVAATGTWTSSAMAQDASITLEEITITATRREDTVNRVALAVTAQTQENLDQQGIRTIADLQTTVPGLRITGSEGSGLASISIRGVSQQVGAATTGFYLDETSLQKRNAAGFASQNGTPIPPLFDLDRVEVLRGPQGTLFGGGSEGGTVRYIQPQPSLTTNSAYARAQYLTTENGDPTTEFGIAGGGPLINNTLGVRASFFARNTGGFIDLTDYRDGRVYDANANSGRIYMGRVAATWAPSSNSKVTASYFKSRDESDHNSNAYNTDVPRITVPTACYNITGSPAGTAFLPVGNPGRSTPRPFAGGAACAPFANQPGYFTAPGYTIGPLDLKPYQSVVAAATPTKTDVEVASVDGQLQFGTGHTLRSITSYIHDLNTASQPQTFIIAQVNYVNAGGVMYSNVPFQINQGVPFSPNVTASVDGSGRGAFLQPNSRNQRFGVTQEFRLSSPTEAEHLTYVGGLYFSRITQSIENFVAIKEEGYLQLSGTTVEQRYGVPNPGFYTRVIEHDKDVEIAGFGEANWRFNDHWKATVGVRVTRITTDVDQTNYGPNSYNLSYSVADGTLVIRKIEATPVTPKLSVQYSFTDDKLMYLTAAKGFRAGGVNQVISSVGKLQLSNQFGLTTDALPKTYGEDSVWSYELGGKFRMWNGRAQLNTAVYHIDRKNVQANVALGGDGFIVNAPSAESEGAELELQVRPFQPLTLNAAFAYSKAKYTSTVVIPGTGGRSIVAVRDGAAFPFPEKTVDVGVQYDFNLGDDARAYARADYRWAEDYALNPSTAANYAPDSNVVPQAKNLNLRLGVKLGAFDVSLFGNNVTNVKEGAPIGGRIQCATPACTAFGQYNLFTVNSPVPRQIGLQMIYRK